MALADAPTRGRTAPLRPLLEIDVVAVTIDATGGRGVAIGPDGQPVTFVSNPRFLVKVAELLATGRNEVRIRVDPGSVVPLEATPGGAERP